MIKLAREFPNIKIVTVQKNIGIAKEISYGIEEEQIPYVLETVYDLDEKKLSLSHDIITKVKAMRSKKAMEKAPLTREEELEEQVSNLKKALEYSELRNQGLMKVIEISSKEYGEDLLKKAGAKQ